MMRCVAVKIGKRIIWGTEADINDTTAKGVEWNPRVRLFIPSVYYYKLSILLIILAVTVMNHIVLLHK